MISEESCDTEDWSNGAENSALITGIDKKKKLQNKTIILNFIFDQINIIDEHERLLSKQILLTSEKKLC